MVVLIGLEPMTLCLEDRCSIQLSYKTGSTLEQNKNIDISKGSNIAFIDYSVRLHIRHTGDSVESIRVAETSTSTQHH